VGEVQLDHIKASGNSTLSALDEVLLKLLDLTDGHAARGRVLVVKTLGAGTHDIVRPATGFLCRDSAGADPWGNAAGFATSVGELDGDLGVLTVGEVDILAESVDMGIEPDTSIPWFISICRTTYDLAELTYSGVIRPLAWTAVASIIISPGYIFH
jgi:hypothetical protein